MRDDVTVTLAGKRYPLRYRLEQRDQIEEAGSNQVTLRSLFEVMTSGRVRDQAIVLWAGIKGANQAAKVTPRGLIEEFDRHDAKGGDYYNDVLQPAYIAVIDGGLLGKDADADEYRRLLKFKDAEGKDDGPPASVPAGQ